MQIALDLQSEDFLCALYPHSENFLCASALGCEPCCPGSDCLPNETFCYHLADLHYSSNRHTSTSLCGF